MEQAKRHQRNNQLKDNPGEIMNSGQCFGWYNYNASMHAVCTNDTSVIAHNCCASTARQMRIRRCNNNSLVYCTKSKPSDQLLGRPN